MATEESGLLYDGGRILETVAEAEISNGDPDNTAVLMRGTLWEVVDQCTLPTGEPYYKLRQYRADSGDAKGTTLNLLGAYVDSGKYFRPLDAAASELQTKWSEFGMQGNVPPNMVLPKGNLRH